VHLVALVALVAAGAASLGSGNVSRHVSRSSLTPIHATMTLASLNIGCLGCGLASVHATMTLASFNIASLGDRNGLATAGMTTATGTVTGLLALLSRLDITALEGLATHAAALAAVHTHATENFANDLIDTRGINRGRHLFMWGIRVRT
jgi:hypothetical protein